MSLRERISNWKLPLPYTVLPLAVPKQMGFAVKIVEKQFSDIQPKQPSVTDLDRLFDTIFFHFKSKKTLDGLSLRDIRRSPWILFTFPKTTPGSLAKNKNFCVSYFGWLDSQLKSGSITILLFVYLRDYPLHLETFHLWRRGIYSCLSRSQSPRIQLIKSRCDRFQLLAEDGHKKFAEMILDSKSPPQNFLEDAGLTGQLENQGFSHAVFGQILWRINQELLSGRPLNTKLKNLFSFAVIENENRKSLRFESSSKYLAEALLLPFSENKAHMDHQREIQNFLVDLMGDPRIVKSHWINVDQKAKEVIFGWLVEATLDIFFRILDRTADKIWRYRKAFWNAYYQNGYIRHAWAVLGNDAVAIAKQIDDRKIMYGELSGAYARNQSVLLLRIGDLIIAEWSHNGKCRIWRDIAENQHKIPMLYKTSSSYSAASLRKDADFEQVHHASEYSTWQSKVEQFIRRHTNIKIFQIHYMP